MFLGLLQYECLSTTFYLLIFLCFNQLLRIYVSGMHHQFFRIVYLWSGLYLHLLGACSCFFQENYYDPWLYRKLKITNCIKSWWWFKFPLRVMYFSSKVVIFKLHKEITFLFKNHLSTITFSLKKNPFCRLFYTTLTLNMNFVEFTIRKKSI